MSSERNDPLLKYDPKPLTQAEIDAFRDVIKSGRMLITTDLSRLLATLSARDAEIARLKEAIETFQKEVRNARFEVGREAREAYLQGMVEADENAKMRLRENGY